MASPSLHFGPEWMRSTSNTGSNAGGTTSSTSTGLKHPTLKSTTSVGVVTPQPSAATTALPPSTVPGNTISHPGQPATIAYSSLLAPASTSQAPSISQSPPEPFRYQREDIVSIWRRGKGSWSLGIEVERYEGVVQDTEGMPCCARDLNDTEAKLYAMPSLNSRRPSISHAHTERESYSHSHRDPRRGSEDPHTHHPARRGSTMEGEQPMGILGRRGTGEGLTMSIPGSNSVLRGGPISPREPRFGRRDSSGTNATSTGSQPYRPPLRTNAGSSAEPTLISPRTGGGGFGFGGGPGFDGILGAGEGWGGRKRGFGSLGRASSAGYLRDLNKADTPTIEEPLPIESHEKEEIAENWEDEGAEAEEANDNLAPNGETTPVIEAPPAIPNHSNPDPKDILWQYIDDQKVLQGPFTPQQLATWNDNGWLRVDLPMNRPAYDRYFLTYSAWKVKAEEIGVFTKNQMFFTWFEPVVDREQEKINGLYAPLIEYETTSPTQPPAATQNGTLGKVEEVKQPEPPSVFAALGVGRAQRTPSLLAASNDPVFHVSPVQQHRTATNSSSPASAHAQHPQSSAFFNGPSSTSSSPFVNHLHGRPHTDLIGAGLIDSAPSSSSILHSTIPTSAYLRKASHDHLVSPASLTQPWMTAQSSSSASSYGGRPLATFGGRRSTSPNPGFVGVESHDLAGLGIGVQQLGQSQFSNTLGGGGSMLYRTPSHPIIPPLMQQQQRSVSNTQPVPPPRMQRSYSGMIDGGLPPQFMQPPLQQYSNPSFVVDSTLVVEEIYRVEQPDVWGRKYSPEVIHPAPVAEERKEEEEIVTTRQQLSEPLVQKPPSPKEVVPPAIPASTLDPGDQTPFVVVKKRAPASQVYPTQAPVVKPTPAPVPPPTLATTSITVPLASLISGQTSAISPSSTGKAWATVPVREEAAKGLKEIQEAEARKAKETTKAKAPPPLAVQSSGKEEDVGTMTWGLPTSLAGGRAVSSAKEVTTPSSSTPTTAPAVWANPAKAVTAPGAPKKGLSMKDIQEEEERRKKKEKEVVTTAKRVSDNKPPPPALAAAVGGAWATVGHGGKSTPSSTRPSTGSGGPSSGSSGPPLTGLAALPPRPSAAAIAGSGMRPAATSSSSPLSFSSATTTNPVNTSRRPAAATATSATAVSSKTTKSEDLATPAVSADTLKWMKDTLKGRLSKGITVDEVVGLVLSMQEEEEIADTIYQSGPTLPGKRFAAEFIERRNADNVGGSSTSGSAHRSVSTSTAEVAKAPPPSAPSQDSFGYKVVKKKGKGR